MYVFVWVGDLSLQDLFISDVGVSWGLGCLVWYGAMAVSMNLLSVLGRSSKFAKKVTEMVELSTYKGATLFNPDIEPAIFNSTLITDWATDREANVGRFNEVC